MNTKIIFIDWISTPYHADFNQNFFGALDCKDAQLFVFDDGLILDDQKTEKQTISESRFRRACQVIKLCWRHKKQKIFLLTYDPVFIILIQLFCRHLNVFEHATIPEGRSYRKHAIWQRLFFWRVRRFAQFPQGLTVLKLLKQNVVYLGSPLATYTPVNQREDCDVFLAPSDRLEAAELLKLRSFIKDAPVVLRKSALSAEEFSKVGCQMTLRPTAWIELDELLPKLKAVVIGVNSEIRGSGWFNDAIAWGMPIVITSESTIEIFKATFPEYPFCTANSDEDAFNQLLAALDALDVKAYISSHNQAFKARFDAAMSD